MSAVEKMLPVLDELRRLEARRNETVDPLMQRWPVAYPLSIGTVHAGDWASTVPDLLIAEGRLGVALGETPAQARADLEGALARLCERFYSLPRPGSGRKSTGLGLNFVAEVMQLHGGVLQIENIAGNPND